MPDILDYRRASVVYFQFITWFCSMFIQFVVILLQSSEIVQQRYQVIVKI